MSDIQLYLIEIDKKKPEARRIAENTAYLLEAKQTKLLDVITSLEEYINDQADAGLRGKSIAYLADVLESVKPRVLTGNERRLLCDFVLGRLEGDVEGVGASARVLTALEGLGKWDAATAQKVFRVFLQHTHPLRQFKLQTERYPVIQLVDLLLAKYRGAVQELHEQDPEVAPRLISYFEGEKDPRNLMIVFSLLLVPMTEWDVAGLAQDLFEAVFNYFPITFKPPPDDPYGITAQDLKDRLRDCIAANSEFAPHAFPALLDKLDSTSFNTKRDVLQTIQACTLGYHTNTINLYSVTLWDALKFEVLNVQEEDLAEEALKALALVAQKFSDPPVEGPLNAYLRPIIKECNEHLEDAPTKQSQAAGRILLSIAGSSPLVADKIARGVLPTLFTLYQASDSIAKRRGLLEVFSQIVKAYSSLENSANSAPPNPEALQTFAKDALDALLRALINAPKSEVSFRLSALDGLVQMVSIRNVLSSAEVNHAVDSVVEIILHEHINGHGDIRAAAIKALIEIAHHSPEAVRNQAIPAFMVELPDTPDESSPYGAVLEAFAQLSGDFQIFDTVVLRLKNKLHAAQHQRASLEYQRALLLALLYAFTFGTPVVSEEGGKPREAYYADYAEPLIAQVRDALPSERDDSIADIVGRLTNAILRSQSFHFQNTAYVAVREWLLPQSDEAAELERIGAIAPFSLYFYASIRPDMVDPIDTIRLLRALAAQLSQTTEHETSGHDVLLEHISLLVNKFLAPASMQQSLQEAHIEPEALLQQSSPATLSHSSTGLSFAVTKALIIANRSPALTTKYIQLLLATLPAAPRSFAHRFAGLLAPDDLLSKANHCTVSGLYKQRTFSHLVLPLIAAIRTADSSSKPNLLIALAGILPWLPYSIIQPHLASLIAPLLQTLDLSSSAPTSTTDPTQPIPSAALAVFESLLMHDPALATEHSASLITRLLNATAPAQSLPDVRAKALVCLALVPRQLKREAVLPYRRPVVKRLLACLDDARRNVRAEAVRCRSAWLVLEEDDGDGEGTVADEAR